MAVLHDLSPTATSQIEATVSTFAPDCPRAADVLPKLMAAANALPAVSLVTALLFSASSSSAAAAAAHMMTILVIATVTATAPTAATAHTSHTHLTQLTPPPFRCRRAATSSAASAAGAHVCKKTKLAQYQNVTLCSCGGRSTQCVPPGQAVSNTKSDSEGSSANVLNCTAAWEGRRVPLSVPLLLDDHEICAANVSLLLKTFKESTATIFRFCLLEKRVLFLGRSSPAWTTCKMVSAPYAGQRRGRDGLGVHDPLPPPSAPPHHPFFA